MEAIDQVGDTDIICGRSSLALKHTGNIAFHQIINLNRELYATTSLKTEKTKISKSIVAAFREVGGRFLERVYKLDEEDKVAWKDIGDKRAAEKVSQALREGQPKLLKKLGKDPHRNRSASVRGATMHEGCTDQVQNRGECSHEHCTNIAQMGGICIKHGGAKKRVNKTCSFEGGCTNFAQSGGVCRRHGAEFTRKTCTHEGCTNIVVKGGVCIRHGAETKKCSHEGCTNKVIRGGVCWRHGDHEICSHNGCDNWAVKEGVCGRHGGRTTCSHKGCTNQARVGGVACPRHATKVAHKSSRGGCNTSNVQKGGAISSMGEDWRVDRNGRMADACNHKRGEQPARKTCSHEGCANHAQNGGVCMRHGGFYGC